MKYKIGTRIPLTEGELLELTLNRLSRIAHKGMHQDRYVFLVHEVREVLKELLTEVKEEMEAIREGVNDTPLDGRSNYALCQELNRLK